MTQKLPSIVKCIIRNEKDKFLILKRTNYKNDGTEDLWDIPGGTMNEDENIISGLIREIEEETKIIIQNSEQNLEMILTDSGKETDKTRIKFTLYTTKYKTDVKKQIILSAEHKKHKWISYGEMNNYDFHINKNRVKAIKKYLENI